MTPDELVEFYRETFYLTDDGVIPFALATILANRMPGSDALWAMLVGPSSGGKSEIINAVSGAEVTGVVRASGERKMKPFTFMLGDLTSNTFLSGASSNVSETSLLYRVGASGVFVHKDFTTILSKGIEQQATIMGQMREIYDGHFKKDTGTGKSLEWKGKLGFLAGVTEAIYILEEKFNDMGSRWVNYVMQPLSDEERITTTRKAIMNGRNITEQRKRINEVFVEYLTNKLSEIPPPDQVPTLTEEELSQIALLTNFSSIARSPNNRDYRGQLQFSISSEMPMRMAGQFALLARTFKFMYGDLRDSEWKIIPKIAFDCIPKGRRMVLDVLAGVIEANTAGVAVEIGYPSPKAREWLEDLAVRGIVKRFKHEGSSADWWKIKDEYIEIMRVYRGIEATDKILQGDENEVDLQMPDRAWALPYSDADPDVLEEMQALQQKYAADYDF